MSNRNQERLIQIDAVLKYLRQQEQVSSKLIRTLIKERIQRRAQGSKASKNR